MRGDNLNDGVKTWTAWGSPGDSRNVTNSLAGRSPSQPDRIAAVKRLVGLWSHTTRLKVSYQGLLLNWFAVKFGKFLRLWIFITVGHDELLYPMIPRSQDEWLSRWLTDFNCRILSSDVRYDRSWHRYSSSRKKLGSTYYLVVFFCSQRFSVPIELIKNGQTCQWVLTVPIQLRRYSAK